MKERLQSLLAKRAKLVDRMDVLLKATETAAAGDGEDVDDENIELRDFTEDEQKEWSQLEKDIAEIDKQIERHQKLTTAQAAHAKPMKVGDNPVITGGEIQRPKGTRMARMARCLVLGKNNPMVAAKIAETKFGDPEIAKALETSTGEDGGVLVPTQYYEEIIEFLRPASVMRNRGARIIPIDGATDIGKQSGGASAEYVGEGKVIPATKGKYGNIILVPRKLAAKTAVSNDLMKSSSFSMDIQVRDDLVGALAERETKGFLLDKGAGNTPRGARYWVKNADVLTMTATPDIAKITNDLGRMQLRMLNANIRIQNPGWVFPHTVAVYLRNLRDTTTAAYAFPEMQDGMLLGWPYDGTTQIPVGATTEILGINFNDCIIGESEEIMIEASTEAAYTDEDNNLVSAFDRDQTVIRAIAKHDFAVRHEQAIAVMDGITWGIS